MRLFFAYAGRQHMSSCSTRAVAYIVTACVYKCFMLVLMRSFFALACRQHMSSCSTRAVA